MLNGQHDNCLFVTDQFKTGGVETVFMNLARTTGLKIKLLPVHHNLDQHLINLLPSNVDLLHENLKIKRTLAGLVRTVLLAKKIRKKYHTENQRVINFSDTLTTLLFSYVLNPHNCVSWIHCNPEALLNAKTYRLYWWLLSKCQQLVFLSEDQRDLFYRLPQSRGIDKKRAVVCTNFINLESLKKQEDQPVEVAEAYFFSAARLDLRSKDYLTLIRAYSLLPDEIQNHYQLLIAGEGPDKVTIKNEIAKCHQENRIILLGNVENPYQYMKNSRLFIHASISEGFAMSILEALACGANVVASDCKVGPRVILQSGKYGRLYKLGDPLEIVKTIQIALKDPIDPGIAKKRAAEITKLGMQQAMELLNED